MQVPFTWKPTGLVHGRVDAPSSRSGEVRPLEYFGRTSSRTATDDGELHVLDAHCPTSAPTSATAARSGRLRRVPVPRLGLGPRRRPTVRSPTRTGPTCRKQLRVWPVVEQYDCVFMWHHPHGDAADVGDARHLHVVPAARRPTRPTTTGPTPSCRSSTSASRCTRRSRSRTAPTASTSSTCTGRRCTPVLLDWEIGRAGVAASSPAGPTPAATTPTRWPCASTATSSASAARISVFEGSCALPPGLRHSRRSTTSLSTMFYSIWWPRRPGRRVARCRPTTCASGSRSSSSVTLWDDLEIWRYQKYVEHPALAQQDAKPYGALRKWARQFYEIEPTPA